MLAKGASYFYYSLDQHPSLISVPSLGNSYTTIAMNTKHGIDVGAMGRAMGLSETEKSWLGRLPIGEGIVKLQGRWTRPFHVRFPHFPVSKGEVSDERISEEFLRDSALSGEYPRPLASERQIPVLPLPDEISIKVVDGVETAFLRDVMEFPTSGINERVRRLNISVRKAYSLLSSLSLKNLIGSSLVSTPKGKKMVLRITAAGKQSLGDSGDTTDVTSNESVEHWYWKRTVYEELRRQGIEVEIEKDGADLVAAVAGKRIAVEIETGKSDWNANVTRNLQNGVDLILIVWTNRKRFDSSDARVRQFYIGNFLAVLKSPDMFKDLLADSAAA
ncbi:MAG: hypothetical protein HY645_09895 [Acidobacteria bacterium]|nr:hypothetical protein [Acidobacteriota bacterium]